MASYTLHIQYVDRPAETRTFTQSKVTFGRDSGDVVLHDTQVSGKHGEIIFENGTLRYTDVGSTNGSFLLQGQRVANIELTPGIALRLGNSLITVQVIDAPNVAGKGRTMIAGPGMAPGFPAPMRAAPPGGGATPIPRPGGQIPAPAPPGPPPGGFAFAPTGMMQGAVPPGGMPPAPQPGGFVPQPAPMTGRPAPMPAPMAAPMAGRPAPMAPAPMAPAPQAPAPMAPAPMAPAPQAFAAAPQPMPAAPPGPPPGTLSGSPSGPASIMPASPVGMADEEHELPDVEVAPAPTDPVGAIKHALSRGLDVFLPVAAGASLLLAGVLVPIALVGQLALMILPLGIAALLTMLLALVQLAAMTILVPSLYRYILGAYLGKPVDLQAAVQPQIANAKDVIVNCFVPGIVLGVFAGPIYFCEGKKLGDVISRNFNLLFRNPIPVFGSLIGVGVAVSIVMYLIAWILAMLPFGGLLASMWSMLVMSVMIAYFASFSVAMYFDLRRRYEGGDPEGEARTRLDALPPGA